MEDKIYLEDILQENIVFALKWAPKIDRVNLERTSDDKIKAGFHFNPETVERIECNMTNVIEMMYQAMGATLCEYHNIISERLEKQGIKLDGIVFNGAPFN